MRNTESTLNSQPSTVSMSVAQISQDRSGASPLMSNNPFRNKIASAQSPVQPPFQATTIRPISTNPFLDSNELAKENTSTIRPVPANGIDGTTDLFASMDMNNKARSPDRASRPVQNGGPGRPENMPPRPTRLPPPPNHRSTPSEEERRRQAAPARRGTELDIFADPPMTRSREHKATRRNSESSVRDKPSSLDSEEEKRRRDRRSRDPRTGKYKPSRRMDIIDKLDVTSIYGAGMFHHDGPFDACNPNRNKKRHRYAPMQAFPKDSSNMQIGGKGPVKPQMDYDRYHGYGQEAHIDFNEAGAVDDDNNNSSDFVRRPQPERSNSFHPMARDAVHGQESAGLGTSTFLEGAPASRIAIERRDSEIETPQQPVEGGLSRKKSLAQKIRGVRPGGNRVQSPDSERGPTSPLATGRSDSAVNPFFKDYDKDYERKGQQIAQAEELNVVGRARAPSSPRAAPVLEKQVTNENVEGSAENKPSGFLGRMKSLKKTKSRYEKRDPS